GLFMTFSCYSLFLVFILIQHMCLLILFPFTVLFRSRSISTTRTPASAMAWALVKPMPEAAPVTAATCPCRVCAALMLRGPLRRRSEEHTSELQSRENLVCRLLLEKKNMYFNVVCCRY